MAKEYQALPEKETVGTDIKYQKEIMFYDVDVNLIDYREKRIEKGEEKETEFAWITSIKMTKNNAGKRVCAGRKRWKIENQGFNRQKHWQGNIEHACSWNEKAQKNHYLMEQIADFMKQLYEYFFLKKNGIKKTQKNISSEWLASFGRQLTETEDINTELQKAVLNSVNFSKEGDACQEEKANLINFFTFHSKRGNHNYMMWITQLIL